MFRTSAITLVESLCPLQRSSSNFQILFSLKPGCLCLKHYKYKYYSVVVTMLGMAGMSAGVFAFAAVYMAVPMVAMLYSWLPEVLDCPCVIISPDLGLMFSWLWGILIISTLAIGMTISSGCWHCLCLSQPIRSFSLTSVIIFRQKVLGTLPANPHFGCWPNKALYGTTVIASFVWYWSSIRQNTSQHFIKAQVMQYYLLLLYLL